MASTRYHFTPLRRGAGAAYAGQGSDIVFINSNGPYVTSSNGVSVFNDRFGNQIGTHNFGNAANLRAFMLLHELGHELASETGFQEDAKNPYSNMRQSMTVVDKCF